MRPATAVSTRNGRVAFVLGGSLFIASAVALALETGALAPGGMSYENMTKGAGLFGFGEPNYYAAIFGAGVIVFAWGVRGEGSVVARNPLGMVALSILGLVPLLLFAVLQISSAIPGRDALNTVATFLFNFSVYLAPIAGAIGVIQIGRASAVPDGWRWIPAVVFSLGILTWVAAFAQGYNLGQDEASKAASTVVLVLIFLVEFAGALLLGFAAIGLAIAARSRPEVPKEPATDQSAR